MLGGPRSITIWEGTPVPRWKEKGGVKQMKADKAQKFYHEQMAPLKS